MTDVLTLYLIYDYLLFVQPLFRLMLVMHRAALVRIDRLLYYI